MPRKFLNYMKNLNNEKLLFILIFLTSCTSQIIKKNDQVVLSESEANNSQRVIRTRCTQHENIKTYKVGDLVCTRSVLKVNSDERLRIHFKLVNRDSDDLYERGYQELLRYKNGQVVERIKLRKDEDAYWNATPFVRVRKQAYLADLDGDGYQEFAILPFSPGSAIWGTVRIFSLKKNVEFWGEGRYQFEGDTFVQLNCMECSKFNPEACNSCE